ncbi:hypothetical protein KDJ56_10745 [Brevibacillus composti]|uniref:Uncharacterized protein n=1 Tax=Brevibacillus composti TaxID=2796470 RepID=A0A7T5EPD8_9BACL|nr:hypothetical protein [Brevibacillus composti]QQE76354.1 hypothetical protein JD108_11060 [Brevibacillus composti]QUO43381.1 hypothetical protein KDJ56_10745 [Brevibacillus composti]
MKTALHQIAYQIGMHPTEMARLVQEGEITGEVPGGNPQSREAWVDLHSLRNFIQWRHDQKRLEEAMYLKAIRHIDRALRG